LAAAGLLRGRTATTHWQEAHQLQALYPDVRVDGNLIYSHEGNIWTSAGATAALDLCLALIQEDCGFQVAMEVAKISVVYVRRPGGQLQFSTPLLAQAASDENFSALHAWMREHLNDDLTIDVLAQRTSMSVRNFQRVYKATMSRTVTKTLLAMRLEAAQRALETAGRRLKSVARDCGFGDVKRLRRAFVRQFGVSPADYRNRFSQTANQSDRRSVRVERLASPRPRALSVH
jgi:transcriptional regulator GlxA family with amidase domain